MGTLWSDLRYGLRLLRHAPGFTAVAVGALALGIGANTAIFSTVDAVLLRPLPFTDPDRVVMVWEDASIASFPQNTPAPGNFVDWKKRNHVFSDMAATRGASANLTADGPPEQVVGRSTTANFFNVLGVRPLLGRTFTDAEDRTGAAVAVISYALWQGRYAGDPAVISDAARFCFSQSRDGVLDADPLFGCRPGEPRLPLPSRRGAPEARSVAGAGPRGDE
jgi:hypothetical protein